MAAGWKRILTTEDGTLATSDQTIEAGESRNVTLANNTLFALKTSNVDGSYDNGASIVMTDSATSGALDTLTLQADQTKLRVTGASDSVSGSLSFKEADNNGSFMITLAAPASLGGNETFVLPASDGTSGQALITDGSGNLSFSTVSGGGVTINNNTDNYLLTASGTLNTINGEADITFDGTKLKTGRHFEYQPDAGPRAGELYDGTDTGVYAANGGVTGGDMIFIPKANTGVTLGRVYTISTAGQAELVSAATSSTNIGKIALLSPSTATSGGATQQMYVRGMATLRTAAIQGTFAYGAPIYLNPSTAGALTFSQPTTSNQYVRRMGYAINAVTISTQQYYIIWFDPSHEYVKIT